VKNVRRLDFVEHLLNLLPISQIALQKAQSRGFGFGSEPIQLIGSNNIPTFGLKELYKIATDEALCPSD
jgi:hypothetical protein